MAKRVELITDGACLGNPGPGGWAAIIRCEDKEHVLTGSERATTNNRMELGAIIGGLNHLPSEQHEVRVTTDSQYVIKAFEDRWLDNWQANGWRNASKQPVKNKDLWLELLDLCRRHHVTWNWVRGHAGHPDNERADRAARDAAAAVAKGL